MWAIKVLNGPQAGRMISLKMGSHTIGRSVQASIKINSPSVSKVHSRFMVTEDKLIVSDNQSSNGVVVNGVKIQNKILKPGDKFSMGEILFDVIKLPKYVSILPEVSPSLPSHSHNNVLPMENLDIHHASPSLEVVSKQTPVLQQDSSMMERTENYVDQVLLPGVYEYSSRFDLKYVLMSFIILFVLTVTALSVIPVLKVSRDFVIDESSRRADSLTKLLVQENRNFIINQNDISVNVRSVRNEMGIDKVFIIDAADGRIIAPINERGRYSKIPFVQRARSKPYRYQEVLENQIGASRPILYNNPMTGEPSPAAYAVVLYNMDRVALDIPRALSLMIQILAITILAGTILYFFLYKIIAKPVHDINSRISAALKEGSNNVELKTQTPMFQNLISNINSALSRLVQEEDHNIQVDIGDKNMEASELVTMFPVPAIAISPEDKRIIAQNELFHEHPLFDEDHIVDKYLDDLTDSSLVESLKDLVEKATDNPNQKHTNHLPAGSGEQFEVSIKSIQEGNHICYYLFCFTEVYEEDLLKDE